MSKPQSPCPASSISRWQVKHVRLLLAVGLGACILSSDLLLHVSPFAHRCLALLVFTVAMWALEAIPYFATALLVPILVVVFQVLEVRQPQHTRSPIISTTKPCLRESLICARFLNASTSLLFITPSTSARTKTMPLYFLP